MKLKECSASKLQRLSCHKKIICFGAGANIINFFKTYEEIQIEKQVAFVVDNDSAKIGKTIMLNNHKVEIKSPSILTKVDMKEYVIVITALRYNEIFAQIQNITGNPKGECYRAVNKRYQLTDLLRNIMCKLPLGNYIVLRGEGDTYENAQALGKYIAGRKYFNKYKLVWLCEHPDRFVETENEKYLNVRAAMKAKTLGEVLKYYWYVGRAKYIFFENSKIDKLRGEQISIYLNHGSPPLKATKGIINLQNNLNYALSPSTFSTDIISEQYSINKERIIVCGSPRTDILFDEKNNEKLKQEFDFKKYEKVVLWAPTFRQVRNSNRVDTNKEFGLGIPVISNEEELLQVIEVLKEKNILLLLKPHLLQDINRLKLHTSEHFQIVLPNKLESMSTNIYELMKFADAMITDYSTIAFDYMLLDRPIGYTIDDIAEYRLGFSVDNFQELMPGNKINTTEDFIEFLCKIEQGKDEFKESRNIINQKIHDFPDGENAKRLCGLLNLDI